MKSWILAGITGLFTAGAVLAQSHGVPPAFLKNTRRMEGDRLSVCADVSGRTLAFDRRVAQLIADSLFLEMDFQKKTVSDQLTVFFWRWISMKALAAIRPAATASSMSCRSR